MEGTTTLCNAPHHHKVPRTHRNSVLGAKGGRFDRSNNWDAPLWECDTRSRGLEVEAPSSWFCICGPQRKTIVTSASAAGLECRNTGLRANKMVIPAIATCTVAAPLGGFRLQLWFLVEDCPLALSHECASACNHEPPPLSTASIPLHASSTT